jgi:hypothetical protein
MTSDNPYADPDFVRRTLSAYTQQLAGLAAAFVHPASGPGASVGAWQAPLAAAYRQAFAPHGPVAGFPAADAGMAGAAWVQWAQASERLAGLTTRIAGEAFARLSRSLADDAPGAAPISTLAGLHALWIECGDAAWQEGARREEFAEAQAECLAALAAVRAATRP